MQHIPMALAATLIGAAFRRVIALTRERRRARPRQGKATKAHTGVLSKEGPGRSQEGAALGRFKEQGD